MTAHGQRKRNVLQMRWHSRHRFRSKTCACFLQRNVHALKRRKPPATLTQADLYGLVNAIRLQETTYKSSGSVHGCALFKGAEMLIFVEDVGRHNALDTIAGWMWMNDLSGADKVFYTTGRLTSEMVIKSAQMGVPIVVSRSGITQMGLDVAERLGLCAVGRATNKRFICYSGAQRLVFQPELATTRTSVFTTETS